MARIIYTQGNPWGRQFPSGALGLEAQRNDLWLVGFEQASRGVQQVLTGKPADDVQVVPVDGYYVQSVVLPELKLKPDVFRRDSRPYNMPSWDEPPDACRMTFIVDARSLDESSHIYQFLDRWRQVVRAGRGGLGNETNIVLDKNYRINYRYNVTVRLLKGGVGFENDLQYSGLYTLENTWLGGFKFSDLSYKDNALLMLEATFYPENIIDETGRPKKVMV